MTAFVSFLVESIHMNVSTSFAIGKEDARERTGCCNNLRHAVRTTADVDREMKRIVDQLNETVYSSFVDPLFRASSSWSSPTCTAQLRDGAYSVSVSSSNSSSCPLVHIATRGATFNKSSSGRRCNRKYLVYMYTHRRLQV